MFVNWAMIRCHQRSCCRKQFPTKRHKLISEALQIANEDNRSEAKPDSAVSRNNFYIKFCVAETEKVVMLTAIAKIEHPNTRYRLCEGHFGIWQPENLSDNKINGRFAIEISFKQQISRNFAS